MERVRLTLTLYVYICNVGGFEVSGEKTIGRLDDGRLYNAKVLLSRRRQEHHNR